ncbi:unnamed protein product [Coregonus sp. 'balchen']|nr:unnamed protein product [Coregonus sp. 'balchen']
MCESYARSLLRVSVAQICQALGWDAVQLTACDLLSDVLHRYIQQLARGCHRYSELYGRTDPVLEDVGQAFRLLGVSLSELEDYVHNLEPVGFSQQTPLFPLSKNNMLQFPQPGEEEEALADMGTSAEAMQVPLDDTDEDMDDDEAVNDENHPVKRHLDSPDAAMGMMPTSKRPRMHPGFSPDWSMEPREPLTSLNPQRVPPGMMASHSHDSMGSMSLSPETPGPPTLFRPQPVTPGRHSDHKSHGGQGRKGPKGSSPGRPRTKSPKGVNAGGAMSGSPIRSPKSSKEQKKSPGRTKSPKSPKSPKMGSGVKSGSQGKAEAQAQVLALQRLPLSALSERMGKENIHVLQSLEDRELAGFVSGKLGEPGGDNADIDDSIDAVIARACAEREPDPFAFSSGSESESDGFSSPRRLTIMEPGGTPKLSLDANSLEKDTSMPLHLNAGSGPGNWTMDDSINEVIRKVNQGGPNAAHPQGESYLSSASASPPTPEPLLKMYEEKNKLVSSADIKKKLKKELKTKMKKKEKGEKPKDKERDKGKMKEKNKDKNKDSFSKEAKMPWKDFGNKDDDLREHFLGQRSGFSGPEGSMIKIKSRDGGDGSGRKEKDKHKDKKKDKEKSKKGKDKRDKGKDRQKISSLTPFGLGDMPALFSPSTCLRIPSMLPPLPPILQEKDVKSKEKDKKKDKKEKKKKKDKDKEKEKEREKSKEKEREKEEKRKEKEKEKEKREKEKDKEKERIRLEKVKVETPVAVPSPVIPRLTLRVGAGQDKIVISKVVPNSEPPLPPPKMPAPKIPATKSGPGSRLQPPPPPPVLSPVVPSLLSPASILSSSKLPVRSVITETVRTYVVRDELGNQIWICPGCNKPDDGSPMIGCDDCDDWYHWPCVGMVSAPPEDQQWFCVKCAGKKKDKKHKKRKHKVH